MRLTTITVMLCTAALISGCVTDSRDYWVKEISVPPGSTEIVRSVMDEPALPVPPGLQAGKPSELLLLSFNNIQGWDKVTEHVDGCLAKAGYTRIDAAGKPQIIAMGGTKPDDLIRLYRSPDPHYAVWLVNIGGTITDSHQTHLPDIQDYTLFVARME